ncbi:MAG: hypothetical protein FWD26_11320 [Treponema sp.]|nr:hypothetical protein [Treponema sp.]
MIKIIIKSIAFILLCIIAISCDSDNNNGSNTSALVKVTFFNNSSYDVDIFHNFNPQFFDPTTYLGTVDSISRELEVQVPASSDTLLGDTFYLRYKILLANRLEAGTADDIYIHAERTMSNISFVIESGRSYLKIIEDPPVNELRFVNGIIKVHNLTTGQLWVENHGAILPQKGRENAWLTLGQMGFFELSLPFLAESWPMNSLLSRDSHGNRTSFPSFELERGKLYSFEISNTGISIPVVTNINPLAF